MLKQFAKRLDVSFLYYERELEDINQYLMNQTLFTEKELQQIAKKLDQLSQNLNTPEAQAHIATLYGRLESLIINNKIDVLVDHSIDLAKNTSHTRQITQQGNSLKKEITSLWDDYSLSQENQQLISLAMQMITMISSEIVIKDAPDQIEHSPDALFQEEGQLAIELCEAAHLFYQNKIEAGIKKLNQLTAFQRKTLAKHCAILKTKLPITSKDMHVAIKKHPFMKLIRALVGYANELAQGKAFYPSQKSIEMMFDEVESIISEENKST